MKVFLVLIILVIFQATDPSDPKTCFKVVIRCGGPYSYQLIDWSKLDDSIMLRKCPSTLQILDFSLVLNESQNLHPMTDSIPSCMVSWIAVNGNGSSAYGNIMESVTLFSAIFFLCMTRKRLNDVFSDPFAFFFFNERNAGLVSIKCLYCEQLS